MSAWINPADVTATNVNRVIASNGAVSGNGLVLRQSQHNAGRVEFAVGTKGAYSYKNYVIAQGPVNYWRLNDTTTTASDQMGNSNGTLHGTAGTNYIQTQTGPTADGNKATYFDGSSGYVSVPYTTANNFKTNSPYSIELWVNPSSNAGANPYVVGQYSSADNLTGGVTYNCTGWTNGIASAFCFGIGDSSGNLISIHTNNTFAAGSWYHVVATYDGLLGISGMKIYVNNVLQATSTCYNLPLVANSAVSVAWAIAALQNPVNYFKGYISDVALYPYKMSAQQVADHYQTGLTTNLISVPNQIVMDHPVAYYRMNETAGTAMYDVSGVGNTGTYVGTPTSAVNPVILGQTSPLASAGTDSGSTSALLDGAAGYATFPNSTGPNFGAPIVQQISLEAWVYPTNVTGNFAIINNAKSTAPQNGTDLIIQNGKFLFWVEDTAAGYLQATTTTVFTINNWYHVVATYNGVPGASASVAIYVNGALQGVTYNGGGMGGTTIFDGNAANWCVGKYCNGSTQYFQGNITEAAIYNYALTATQISNHYNAGAGAGWNFCQSKTPLGTSLWDHVVGYWDGTSEYLYVNGQQECKTSPTGITYSGATANISVGSDTSQSSTSFWKGLLTSIKIFGTEDNSAVIQTAGTTTAFSDFAAESNRFRQIPTENIVTSNLIMSFDASNAQFGAAPYTQGTVCPSSGSSMINSANLWTDLSNQSTNGTLWGFTSCNTTTSGWVGTGSTGLPYAIALNGTSNFVTIPATATNTFTSVTAAFTVDTWINPQAQTASNPYFFGQYNSSGFGLGYSNTWAPAKTFGVSLVDTHGDWVAVYTNNTFNYGNWYHLVVTYNGNKNPNGIKVYVNGVLQATTTSSAGPLSSSYSLSVISNPYTIGYLPGSANYYFVGQISAMKLYNTNIDSASIAPVIQNCNAQQGRYGVSACAAP